MSKIDTGAEADVMSIGLVQIYGDAMVFGDAFPFEEAKKLFDNSGQTIQAEGKSRVVSGFSKTVKEK